MDKNCRDGTQPSSSTKNRITLIKMALSLLKVGAIGFGGGIAIISLLEREWVEQLNCLEVEEFLHGVSLGQILGPLAVNISLFIGYRNFGLLGALVAEIAFLLPSIIIVIMLSWFYFSFHEVPALKTALVGIAPVVIALIANAAWSLGRKSIRSRISLALCLAGCFASLTHVNTLWILASAGFVGWFWKLNPTSPNRDLKKKLNKSSLLVPPAVQLLPHTRPLMVVTSTGVGSVSLLLLAGVFLKIGFVFFGGGFVLIPILKQQLVNDLGWLSQQEFLDGVAISQLTPGPIAVLGTFAGYQVAGFWGALTATAALFAPATVLMLIMCQFYQKFHALKGVQNFLAGVNPAVVGLIVAAAIALAPNALSLAYPLGIILCLLSLFLISYCKWHPAILLAMGAIIGIFLPELFP